MGGNLAINFALSSSTKIVGKGTGLGLAIVYSSIQSHGGFIICESNVAEGTSFHLYFLVIRRDIQNEYSPTIDDAYRGGNETILLIGDDTTIRCLGEELLEMLGNNSITASNGELAIEIYKKLMKEIGLIIIDLIMPGVGGKQRMVNLLALNLDVKIIAASGYYGDISSDSIFGEGIQGFYCRGQARLALYLS